MNREPINKQNLSDAVAESCGNISAAAMPPVP